MVMKVTNRNYRQYYKEYYGIDFGSEFSIHHLDGNRDNNDIKNLILLPKELHNRLHFTNNIFKEYCEKLKDVSYTATINDTGYETSCVKIYMQALEDVKKWYYYKFDGYNNIVGQIIKVNHGKASERNMDSYRDLGE